MAWVWGGGLWCAGDSDAIDEAVGVEGSFVGHMEGVGGGAERGCVRWGRCGGWRSETGEKGLDLGDVGEVSDGVLEDVEAAFGVFGGGDVLVDGGLGVGDEAEEAVVALLALLGLGGGGLAEYVAGVGDVGFEGVDVVVELVDVFGGLALEMSLLGEEIGDVVLVLLDILVEGMDGVVLGSG